MWFMVITVRDAAARLPNGEGTRGDICELLKDSQFLAPGVTDTQVSSQKWLQKKMYVPVFLIPCHVTFLMPGKVTLSW